MIVSFIHNLQHSCCQKHNMQPCSQTDWEIPRIHSICLVLYIILITACVWLHEPIKCTTENLLNACILSGPIMYQAPPTISSEGELELQGGGARALAPPIWLCSEHYLFYFASDLIRINASVMWFGLHVWWQEICVSHDRLVLFHEDPQRKQAQ